MVEFMRFLNTNDNTFILFLFFKFICQPLETETLRRELQHNYKHLQILSADVQYIAKSLVELAEEHVTQADRLIEIIGDHPDVLNVFDNIDGYPSSTIKISQTFV